MKSIVTTAILLIITLIVVPFVTYYMDDNLTDQNWIILKQLLYLCGGFAAYCFIVSELTDNISQVDKLWSLTPIVYGWFIAWKGDWDERAILMAVLVTIWGLRLTFNFARRGGYSWKIWDGEEDYRWAVIRSKPPLDNPWIFRLFNFFFISIYQHFLILLFTLPALYALQGSKPLGIVDYLLSAIIILLVVLEGVADQQQYVYQTEKYRQIGEGKVPSGIYSRGFVREGLWGLVRHPNYACEQAIWIVFYLFSVSATGNWINWSISGALLLVLLFKGSSDLSESISAEKYPAYKDYQKEVPRFIPFLKGF